MIARHWKGIVKRHETGRYLAHLEAHTFATLSRIEGFRGGSIMRREVETGVEFLVVSEWDSVAAIRLFAGDSAERAVVPPDAREMLVSFDREAVHYEIVDQNPTHSTISAGVADQPIG